MAVRPLDLDAFEVVPQQIVNVSYPVDSTRRIRRWRVPPGWQHVFLLVILLSGLTRVRAELVHQWTFNNGTALDSVGEAHGAGYRGPRIEGGNLLLNGMGQCIITAPLSEALTQRTLVTWVALSNLTQQGGTVLTVAVGGRSSVFDGIGYGGSLPNRWNNASESANRTAAPSAVARWAPETSIDRVMIAVVYGDGDPHSIKLYRNGDLYAQYTSDSPVVTYPMGQSHALLGVPHHALLGQSSRADGEGPALAGAIDEARIYSHALSSAEVAGLFREGPVPTTPAIWRTAGFQVVAVLALLALAGAGMRSFETRKYQQRMRVLEQQSTLNAERARIARDMHDKLGANLTSIKLLSELIERELHSSDQAAAHARRISSTARELAQGMDEVVWAVNPEKDHLENLVFYVGAFTEEFLGATAISYRLQFPDVVPKITVPSEVRHHLFLALKEALNNTVKHSDAKRVVVRLAVIGGQLVIEVQDDGIGFASATTVTQRNGLKNMRERLVRIGGNCAIHSQPGSGTSVKLSVSLSRFTGGSHVWGT